MAVRARTGHQNDQAGAALAVRRDVTTDVHTCSICGKRYSGSGNDAEPMMNDGTCCEDCNAKYVIAARLKERRAAERQEGRRPRRRLTGGAGFLALLRRVSS